MDPLILLLVFVVGWELFWFALGVKSIAPWTLKKWLAKKDTHFDIIDVRTPAEFDRFHIGGSRNIPNYLFSDKFQQNTHPGRPLVVICMTGHRSPPVAYRLKKQGYRNVYHLTWGMVAWKLFGGPTVSSSK
jgi:rhodanese-related sulfurtransferase